MRMALLNAARPSLRRTSMKTKKLGVGGKLAGPAYTAADVAVSGELDPADVGQSVMGMGSKFLSRLGGWDIIAAQF